MRSLKHTQFDPRWVQADITSANAAFNAYLQFGDKRPQRHVRAPREVAVTHSGMIEVLLAYLLDFRREEAIGGTFDYLEGISIIFEQDQDASLSMQAFCRGQTYMIAGHTLQSLLQEGSID